MPKTIVVTGCDAAHYGLVVDLLTSLKDAGRDGLTVGFVHVGDDTVPAEITALADCVANVADGGFRTQRLAGFPLAYLLIKPRLPEFFPGYDTYVWLDGDTWVQNRVGLDQIIHCAQLADLCAHPELDPSYYREKIPSDRLLEHYETLYGADQARLHTRMPVFNAGVFGATAKSPLWALWREAMLEVRPRMSGTPGAYFSDQVPLHRLIASGRLSVHPLRALNNWLVHAAPPSVSLEKKRLMSPSYPHEEINIVHLTWATKSRVYATSDGGELSFRYGWIKALFSRQGLNGVNPT